MAITTVNGIAAALPGAQTLQLNKASIATQGAGGWSSHWKASGVPAAGSNPTTAARCTNALTGCIPFTNPGSGRLYLGWLSAAHGNTGGSFEIHDRLAHMGGLSGTSTSSQTVNCDVTGTSDNIDVRRGAADYSDVRWWVEIYTDIGTTAVTLTVTYTNAAGTSGQTTTVSLGGASPLNQDSRMIPIIGSGGEYIQSIQSVQQSATTGTAGNYGITATRHITTVATAVANRMETFDWAALGFPAVENSACLMLVQYCITTSTGTIVGTGKLANG
jgi:hypothetical protein